MLVSVSTSIKEEEVSDLHAVTSTFEQRRNVYRKSSLGRGMLSICNILSRFRDKKIACSKVMYWELEREWSLLDTKTNNYV